MSHPILTFRHLLPEDAVYRCIGGPDWFVALFEQDVPAGGSAVPVVWGRSLSRIANRLHGAPAVVAINCRDCSDERLRDAGFEHVRRFAVLPSASDARWFIPLDSRRAAAGGLSLYQPVRLAGRLAHLAARLAARIGLPFWYRDEICIARRSVSPLEHLMENLLPGKVVRVALSAGAAGRAHHRKLSLAVVSTDGELLAFAKSGVAGVARRLVRNEAAALRAMSAYANASGRVPRLLFAGEVAGSYVHVQTPLPGEPAGVEMSDQDRGLLRALRGTEVRSAGDTRLVRTLRQRISALPAASQRLAPLLDMLAPRLERLRVPTTIVHGDFAPWNIRVHEGVARAFDWEYAELDGLPLIDELNHLMLVGYLVHEWSVETALDRLRRIARSGPLRLQPDEVEALQLVYLLDVVSRFMCEGVASDPITHWFTELLSRFAAPPRVTAATAAMDISLPFPLAPEVAS